jgi:hypothetical protein
MLHLLRLLAALPVAALLLVSPASADAPPPAELMPGVTWERQVQLTPHGPVALTVITAPKPGGLTTIGPVVAGGTMTAPRLKVTQIQRSLGPTAISAGIAGDFTGGSGLPNGIAIVGGVYQHTPAAARSSIGFDADGTLRVTRFAFTGTWRGTGQRRPLVGINQKPHGNQTVLFTPAWGASAPAVANATVVTLQGFPAAKPNADLTGTVVDAAGSLAIPPDGSVLMATGNEAPKLAKEATPGTQVTARLILPTSWANVNAALGGGPLLVRNHRPVFRTSEKFDADELMSRDARAGVGQLDDGRVILVAVDGRQPGYSVGITTYELAQAMARLGAATAAAVQPGTAVTAAFQGRVLNRPAARVGEVPVKEALLVQYAGAYAAPPSVAAIGTANRNATQKLAYTVVRPSQVTAELVAPDGGARPLDSGQREPGTYRFTQAGLDAEGTWRFRVTATDDQNRQSSAERAFPVDFTLAALKVPAVAHDLRVGFTLSRDATATLQIETPRGAVVAKLPPARLAAGAQSLAWDDTTATGAKAPPGRYVARVLVTSDVGTSSLSAAFSLRR